MSDEFIEASLTQIKPYYQLNGISQEIRPEDLSLTPQSKALFEQADPGQSFVGVISLKKNAQDKYDVHLLPSSNRGDGAPKTDRHNNRLLQSKAAFGKGGHNLHLQAVMELGLAEQYQQGLLLGFGCWKSGWGIKFPDKIPEESGLVNEEYLVIRQDGKFKVYCVDATLSVKELPPGPLRKTLYELLEQEYQRLGEDLSKDKVKHHLMKIIRNYHSIAVKGVGEKRLRYVRNHNMGLSEEERVQQLLQLQNNQELQAATSTAGPTSSSSGSLEPESEMPFKHLRINSNSLNDGSSPKIGGALGGCKYSEEYQLVASALLVEHATHINQLPRELPLSVAKALVSCLFQEANFLPPLSSLLPPVVRQHKSVEEEFINEPWLFLYYYARLSGNHALVLAIKEKYPNDERCNMFTDQLINAAIRPSVPDITNPETKDAAKQFVLSRIELLNRLLEAGEDPQLLFDRIISHFMLSTKRGENQEPKYEIFKEFIKKLLVNGANLHLLEQGPLDLSTAKFLIAADANPQQILNLLVNKFTAENNKEFVTLVEELLNRGAKIEKVLQHASLDDEWLIDFLLDKGADLDSVPFLDILV